MGQPRPKTDTVALIRLVAEFMQGLTSSELDDLLVGRSKLAVMPASNDSKKAARRQKVDPSREEMKDILDKLYSMQSREEGEKLLAERFSSRASLAALARYADLPVQQRATIPSLRNRIVESTIGYRLRSQAIQSGTEHTQRIQSSDA